MINLRMSYGTPYEQAEQFRAVSSFDPTRQVIHLGGRILRTLSAFVKKPIEHGGMIDINIDGSFDRAIFGIGQKGSVQMEDMTDFEVTFHTHPKGRANFMFEAPSGADIVYSIWNTKWRLLSLGGYQVHLVFSHEGVYTIYVDPRVNYTDELIQHIIQTYTLNRVTSRSANMLQKQLLSIAEYGVYIFRYSTKRLSNLDEEPINNWPETIPLYINPLETNIAALTKRGVRRLNQTSQQRQARQARQTLQTAQATQKSEKQKREDLLATASGIDRIAEEERASLSFEELITQLNLSDIPGFTDADRRSETLDTFPDLPDDLMLERPRAGKSSKSKSKVNK